MNASYGTTILVTPWEIARKAQKYNHNYDPHTVLKCVKLSDRCAIATCMIMKSIQTWK
jgi:hypothetical protein